MTKNNLKIFSYLLITVFLTLGLSISFQSLLAAWAAPTANPPTCLAGDPGCDPPINTSSTPQSKGGPLTVNFDNVAATGFVAYGKVGIGTTTPYSLLSVQTTAGGKTPLFTIASSTNGAATSTVLTVLANGYVGIGSANPTAKLTVNGGNVGGNILVTSNNGNAVASIGVTTANGFANEGFKFYYEGITTGSTFFDNYYATGDMIFRTKVASAAVEAMRIKSDGKVGIGMTGPQKKLDVATGDIGILGTSAIEQYGLQYREPTVNAMMGGIGFSRTAVANAPTDVVFYTNKANNGATTFNSANEVMRITNGGNVGIGTTNPAEKLEVSGNIKLSGASATYRITNVADPTANQDVATKAYVLAASGGATKTMYLTSATFTGDHNCDNVPANCCASGYHFCDTNEFANGGRRLETTGAGRDPAPMRTGFLGGWIDYKIAPDALKNCGFFNGLGRWEVYQLYGPQRGKTAYFGANGDTAGYGDDLCMDSDPVWCCSD